MNKILLVLVGNIGSGKSTFTKALVEKDFVVISRDSLRYAIGAGRYICTPKYEPTIHQLHVTLLNNFMRLGSNIVIDSTNISRVARKNYIEEGHENNYKVIAIELPRYSKEVSVTRRLSQNHGTVSGTHWEDIWERFNNRYQSPTKEEGFDHVITINGDLPKDSVYSLIEEALNGYHNL